MNVLTNKEIMDRLRTMDGWRFDNDGIRKTYQAATFRAAIGSVVQIAMLAETADHHPDIAIQYSKVTVSLMTHSAGGVTDKDFQLAEQIEQIFGGR